MRNKLSFNNFCKKLILLGLKKNDLVFCHSNLGYFGMPEKIKDKNELCNFYFQGIFRVIGSSGTLVVPTFSNSFFEKKIFLNDKTPSKMGIFSEWVRNRNDSLRSNDPNYSICAVGKEKKYFTKIDERSSFSNRSFFAKFHKKNGKILNFNFSGTTFIHYYENLLKIDYRYNKSFSGIIKKNNKNNKVTWKVFSRKLDNFKNRHDPMPLMNKLRKKKNLFQKFGKGEIFCIDSRSLFNFIRKNYIKDDTFLTLEYTINNEKNILR